MLTKINKLQLDDYNRSKTDLKLSLFALGINPEFKLDKKTKTLLIDLIDSYNTDLSPLRLKAIERFIIGETKPMSEKRITPKQIKEAKNNPEGEVAKAVVKNSENYQKMERIREEIGFIRQIPADKRTRESEADLQKALKELFVLEKEDGMYDPVPPEKSKLDVVIGLLGHWEDPESLAYELYHGNRQQITIRTNDNVKGVISDMIYLAGKPCRGFYVNNNMMSGMSGKSGFVMTWTLTDVKSGIRPKNDRYSTLVDGKESDMDLFSKFGGQLATVGPVQWDVTRKGRI
jgi:hypothetical protein